ncbi:MAG: hypothetical protein AAF682_14805 [Planctomycetota bacterium]
MKRGSLTLACAAVALASPSTAQLSGAAGPAPGEAPATRSCVPFPRPTVWVDSGEDKVLRSELRVSKGGESPFNSLWDGQRVRLFGARDEAVSFNVVLEAPDCTVEDVTASFDRLVGPGGATIESAPADPLDLFNSVGRSIELFYVRYLRIRGVSRLSYDDYDQRHVPERWRRPHDPSNGVALPGTGWFDRPAHDEEVPDIAVPLEAVGAFDVTVGTNQSLWVDVHVPRGTEPGPYIGTLELRSAAGWLRSIPVELEVLDFTLPADFSAKTMVYLGYGAVNERQVGVPYPDSGTPQAALSDRVRDNYFKVLRRHRLTPFDANDGPDAWPFDRPREHWVGKLQGAFYTAAEGYAGPGEGVGHDFFVVGAYGSWGWQDAGTAAMHQRTDAWMSWFQANAPEAEVALYLIDEPPLTDAALVAKIQGWIADMDSNPGPGQEMLSLSTVEMHPAMNLFPTLDIAASWANVQDPALAEPAFDYFQTGGRQAFIYNGVRPSVGSFATEDDGVALRVVAWTHFKRGVDRYFFWEATYFDNFQGCSTSSCPTDLFGEAQTFGGVPPVFDPVLGETGWNHSNGDGVLLYPGNDFLYPQDSYGLEGPLASLRLKHWRRGLQDYEYLQLARAKNPAAVDSLVQFLVPSVLWEPGVDDPSDPTYVVADISWSTDPEVWHGARALLAEIIDG